MKKKTVTVWMFVLIISFIISPLLGGGLFFIFLIYYARKAMKEPPYKEERKEASRQTNYKPAPLSNGLNKFNSEKKIIMWVGRTDSIEFTYKAFKKQKERRTIRPTEVSFTIEGYFYISGFCELRNQPRTFKQYNFETKIKLGSKRYDFEEWCNEALGINVYSICPNAQIKIT